MVEKFHEELEDLKKNVLKMGQLATKMLEKSIEGLKNQDSKKAEWVNTQKNKIAEMDEHLPPFGSFFRNCDECKIFCC